MEDAQLYNIIYMSTNFDLSPKYCQSSQFRPALVNNYVRGDIILETKLYNNTQFYLCYIII
jgi:hypothetical protein